jgi:tetratricopeptide (TPR) repeat protein
MGQMYKEQGLYGEALQYYRNSIAIQEKLGEQPGLAESYYNLGVLSQKQNNYVQAVEWCRKSLQLGRQMESLRPQRNACDCLYESHKALGNTSAALSFHEQFVTLNDSLQKEEINERLEQMEFVRQVMADSLGKEEEKLKIEMTHQTEVRRKNRTLNILLVGGLFLLALALGAWGRMLYFRKNSQIFQNKAEYLEKQHLLNEIALLKTQVNPHFLFNSLSILSSLVHVNPDLSEQFIDQLSRSYRYILEQKEQSLVHLRTELEFIKSYSFLLKIRFENKFDLRIQLPEVALDRFKIAPLTLQLLIENAVKHNRMSLKEPLVIEIFIDGDFLMIKNRLQPRPQQEASTGTGLANIINRYALLTDRSVRAGEYDDSFVVKIPLLDN